MLEAEVTHRAQAKRRCAVLGVDRPEDVFSADRFRLHELSR